MQPLASPAAVQGTLMAGTQLDIPRFRKEVWEEILRILVRLLKGATWRKCFSLPLRHRYRRRLRQS
jgi:hypothetical protein